MDHLRTVLIPTLLSILPGSHSRLCHVTSLLLNSPLAHGSNITDSSFYHCPQPGDPSNFLDCCLVNAENPSLCCERRGHVGFLPGLDDQTLIFISVGVMITCLIASLTVLICCFWSECPLYTACRVNYKHNDAIAFSTKEERMKLNGMPNEEYKIHQPFESNPIKIRPVIDV